MSRLKFFMRKKGVSPYSLSVARLVSPWRSNFEPVISNYVFMSLLFV